MLDLKYLMIIFKIFMLISLLKCDNDKSETESYASASTWKCNGIDRALLRFKISNNSNLTSYQRVQILYQYRLCTNCDLITLSEFAPNQDNEQQVVIDSYYAYYFQVVAHDGVNAPLIGNKILYNKFGECGEYLLEIEDISNISIQKIKNPGWPEGYLFLGLGIVIIFCAVTNFLEKFGPKLLKEIKKQLSKRKDTDEVHKMSEITGDESLDSNKKPAQVKPIKKRLGSLDTFRGFSLFLMIFVNYGSGGYKVLQHVPWHGITIADFVFPWFLWMMGFSIPLATNSLLRKPDAKRLLIFRKIVIRFIKMFFIGIMLNSRFGVQLSKLRIFGVLQRIAVCYLIVATLELILYKKINVDQKIKNWKYYLADLIWSWTHFLVMFAILLVWFLLTYLLPVPGCPTGYMGPGGLDDGGKWYNCTGGVAGYIDRLIITRNHLYQSPTSKIIFKTVEPFDPEGLFGIFNSVILTYMGVQAGRAIIFYENRYHHIIIWSVWSILSLLLYFAVTQFDMTNGWIPVNKNLWTFSYTLVTATSSYVILIIFYFLIDVKGWWTGNPFIFPGKNSILIYTCHSFFGTTFPNQWIVSSDHLSQLLMDLWGSIFWTLLSIYLFYKDIFVNL